MMQNLRFDIAMENAVFMHMVDRLNHLVHVVTHSHLRYVVAAPFNSLVQIHIH